MSDDKIMIGDMILSRNQFRYLYTNDSLKRHGMKNVQDHWPEGIVPVKYHEDIDDDFKITIQSAMDTIMDISCIKFDLETEDPPHYVLISPGTGCSSEIGNLQKPGQNMRLSKELCKIGNIIHEFYHVLGFYHMHTAAQRDNFVKINYKNINEDYFRNFQKFAINMSMFGTQYDYR